MTPERTTDAHTECLECGRGHLHERRIVYTVRLSDGSEVSVPDLVVEVCDCCGEVALGPDAAAKVDAVIAETTEQLTPRELERIREDCGVDQMQMSEILGLGEKTYHRWEKGNQVPSRSMGFYLRILADYPEVFDWLRNRGWRNRNRVATPTMDLKIMFPDLKDDIELVASNVRQPGFNPARALFGVIRR